MQTPDVAGRQVTAGSRGMHPRPKQRLVGVDVADAGHDPLIQQQRLDGCAATR
jgi:hypothetical protein